MKNHLTSNAPTDPALLNAVVAAAQAAGAKLLETFSADARPADRPAIGAALARNEAAVGDALRAELTTLRPDAQWAEEAHETSPLPPGAWWVVDTVEGNINHLHGLPQWGVTITLVSDELPVLSVVHQPMGARTYTAVRGAGAFLNSTQLHASAKSALNAALVVTGQAAAGQVQTYEAIGASITAMLHHALLVGAVVPSTFPLLAVASGQNDVFWQYAPVLSGIAAGILFVQEAGGVVSRIDGTAWHPGSPDILATAPELHGAAVKVLGSIPQR